MDMFDEDLKGVMGARYEEEGQPAQSRAAQEKPRCKIADQVKPVQAGKCMSIPKYAPNYMTRLKGCTKWAMIFGGLTFLFFYWQEAGLMDPMAAVPSMCACTGLGGLKIGMICREGS